MLSRIDKSIKVCNLCALQELGIPTANLDAEAVAATLSDAVTGIYYGWAGVSSDPAVHKACLSVGYNPFYGNTSKTCEPWLLADFAEVRATAANAYFAAGCNVCSVAAQSATEAGGPAST